MKFLYRACAAGLTLSLAPAGTFACATCGCALNSDAAMGYSASPGWRLGLEYDYIHQDELRSGTRKVATVPDGNELERETLNRYLTLSIDYSPTADWNIDFKLPYVQRTHSTYGVVDASTPPADLSFSRNASLGDARLVASYQGLFAEHNVGLQLGLKLPTGRYGDAVKFSAGPLRGAALDASLQPGTGSTDLIVGAYYVGALTLRLSLFANLQFQSAVTSKQDTPGNDFRPGDSISSSIGLRYDLDRRWVPQVQLNFLHKNVDRGALADITDTAGSVIYVSPGITARVIGGLEAFAFVQLPVYSNLVGYQVFPRYAFSVGLSYAL